MSGKSDLLIQIKEPQRAGSDDAASDTPLISSHPASDCASPRPPWGSRFFATMTMRRRPAVWHVGMIPQSGYRAFRKIVLEDDPERDDD